MQLIKMSEIMSTVSEVRRQHTEEEGKGHKFYSSVGL